MDLKLELEKSHRLLIFTTIEKYNQTMTDIMQQLSSFSIQYVTFNKTAKAIKDSLKRDKIKPKKICFIDGITKTAALKPKTCDDCAFLKAPNAFNELEAAILDDPQVHEVIVIDSLSTLLIYEKSDILARYLKDLIRKLGPKRIVFIILEGNRETELINNLEGSFDKIIKLK